MHNWSACSPNWFYLSVLPGLKVKPHSPFPPEQHFLPFTCCFPTALGLNTQAGYPFCSMINSQCGSKDSTGNAPGAVEGQDPAQNTPDSLSQPFVPVNRGQFT